MSTTAAPSPNHRFELLDGLRALAALAVIADHVETPTIRALTIERGLAVDFFYVLSGFVLAHAYGARLAGNTPGARLTPFQFLKLRYVRFWPILWAAFAIKLSLELLQVLHWSGVDWSYWGKHFAAALPGLFFLPSPFTDYPFPIVGPMHTMFFELSANLALALAAPFLTNARLKILLGFFALALIATALHFDTLKSLGWQWQTFAGGFARVAYPFFVGVLTYRLWGAKRPSAIPSWVAAIVLALLLGPPLAFKSFTPYEIVCSLVIFPMLVYFSASARVTGAVQTLCLQAGAYSYAVYLLHVPVAAWVLELIKLTHIDAGGLDLWLYALVTLASVALAFVLRRWYEKPLQRWLGAKLNTFKANA